MIFVGQLRANGLSRQLFNCVHKNSSYPLQISRPATLSAIHRGVRRSERVQFGDQYRDRDSRGGARSERRTRRAIEGTSSPRQQQKLLKKLDRKAAEEEDEEGGRQTRRKRFIDPASDYGKKSLVYQLKHGAFKDQVAALVQEPVRPLPFQRLETSPRHRTESPQFASDGSERQSDSDGRSIGRPVGRSFDRSSGHSSGRSFDRPSGRSFDRSSGRSSGRSFDRSSDRSSDHSFDRSPKQSFDRSSGRSSGRSFDRSSGRPSERSFDHSPDRSFDRSSGRSSERSFGRSSGRSSERSFDRSSGRPSERSFDRPPDRPLDSSPDHSSDRPLDSSSGRSFDRSFDRPFDRSFDRRDDTEEGVEMPQPRERRNQMMAMNIKYTTAASQFLYGKSVVKAALEQGRRKLYNLFIYGGENRKDSKDNTVIARLAERRGVPITIIPNEDQRLMDKMSMGRPHNGFVLETSPIPQLPVKSLGRLEETLGKLGFHVELDHQSKEEEDINGHDTFIPRKNNSAPKPFVLLLNEILDPGNLGGILRTASYLGADAVGITNRSSSTLTPVVLKSAAGAVEEITIFSVDSPVSFIEESRKAGWKTYASVAPPDPKLAHRHKGKFISTAAVEAEQPLTRHPCILVLGNEGYGLSKPIKVAADYELAIPHFVQSSSVDSLNVSVAAGLLCHAFVRAPAIAKPTAAKDKKEISAETTSGAEKSDIEEEKDVLF